MEANTIIAAVSIFTAGITIAIGSIAPALGEGRALAALVLQLREALRREWTDSFACLITCASLFACTCSFR